MSTADWVIIAIYLAFTLALGLWLSRRASGSMEAYFAGGRRIPWWLSGASMAATTFNVDTPLYVAGVVITSGIAGNWEWWSFVVTHVGMIYIFARLWRRAGILTDMELSELRYGGRPAAILRGVRAFLFALPINAIGIAYGMLAMRKVMDSLGVLQALGVTGDNARLWSVVVIALVVLVYAAFSGLWGVVATDFLQLVLALVGAGMVAGFAVGEIGGLSAIPERLQAAGQGDHLSIFPSAENALLPLETFFAYVAIQWWAFRNADGGGQFVQRLVSVPTERDAERSALLFNVINYVVRGWPWIIVALVALIVVPDLQDPETAYPVLMLRYLPAGMLGLVFASLLAAFMSTVSSQVNWGASYLVNDVYRRFVVRSASDAHLVLAGRIATIVITAVASYVAFNISSIREVFRFLIVLGTGTGAVLVLRWFWWRINAWAELAALVASVVMAVLLYRIEWLGSLSYGQRSLVSTATVTAVWVAVMYLTPPEDDATLERFYRRARPGGAWTRIRKTTGMEPRQMLRSSLLRTAAGVSMILGANLAIGAFLLSRPVLGAVCAGISFAGGTALLRWRSTEPADEGATAGG